MYSSILLVSLVASASAIYCPDGYKDFGDDTCYGIRLESNVDRATAYRKCQAEGAELASFDNMFTNVAISSALPAFNFVWIGVSCMYMNRCYDETGETVSFQNFYLTTNTSVGPFVYIDNLGMWGVGDYTKQANGYVCQYKTNNQGCPRNYYGIDDRCYMIQPTGMTADEADANCIKSGGRLASIPSAKHNSYVHWLFTQYRNASFGFLGFSAYSTVSLNWTDASVQTYSNIEYYNPFLGQCGAMAITDDLFSPGSWQSIDCGHQLPFVCGAVRGASFIYPPAFSGVLPYACEKTYKLTNSSSGLIASPAYPENVDYPNYCDVIVTAPVGYKIIAQPDTSLNSTNGYLKLCDSYAQPAKCSLDASSFTSYFGFLRIQYTSGANPIKWTVKYTTKKL